MFPQIFNSSNACLYQNEISLKNVRQIGKMNSNKLPVTQSLFNFKREVAKLLSTVHNFLLKLTPVPEG